MDNKSEIMALEEQMRLAELAPDPDFFQQYIDDDALLGGMFAKAKMLERTARITAPNSPESA